MTSQQITQTILSNATRLANLHQAIEKTFAEKEKHPQDYEQAVRLFQESYDALAFPGGLERGIRALKQHDPATIDVAIEYLKINPYFYRSGYIQEKILRFLKQSPLSKKQILNVHDVILHAITSDRPQASFREYCRLAAHLADETLRMHIENILRTQTEKKIIRRAQQMLETIAQHIPT